MAKTDELTGRPLALAEILAAAYCALRYDEIALVADRAGGPMVSVSGWKAAARSLDGAGWVKRGHSIELIGPREPLVRRLIQQRRFTALAVAVDRTQHRWERAGWQLRAARMALVRGDVREFLALEHEIHPAWLVQWHVAPLQTEALRSYPETLRRLTVARVASYGLIAAKRLDGLHDLLEGLDLERADLLAGRLEASDDPGVRAVLALQRGEVKKAARGFAEALTALRRRTGDRDAVLDVLEGVFAPLAFVLDGSVSKKKQARTQIRRRLAVAGGLGASPFDGHTHLLSLIDGVRSEVASTHPMAVLVESLVARWSDLGADEKRLRAAEELAEELGWSWIAAELAHVRGQPPPDGLPGLLGARESTPAWEQRLRRIEETLGGAKPAKAKKRKRIAWVVQRYGDHVDVSAREQVSGARGWSVGRPIADSRLAKGGVTGMSEQDLRIAACIKPQRSWGWRSETWYEWKDEVWAELIGHPALFDANGEPIRVVRIEPRIRVRPDGEDLIVSLEPAYHDGVQVEELDGAGFEVTAFTKAQRETARLLTPSVRVPRTARGRVDEVIASLGEVFDVEGGSSEIDGDPSPLVRLWPDGRGLRVWLGVRPAPGAPVLAPGDGAGTVLGRVDGRAVRVRRDLSAELRLATEVEEACPTLASAELLNDLVRGLPDPDQALALLEELSRIGACVEWPEGGRIDVKPVSSSALSLKIDGANDWFEASGHLEVDDASVLAFHELLALVEKTPGRFIRLDDGRVLALAEKFRRQLDALARSARRRGKRVEVHALASDGMAQLAEHAEVDESWSRWRERLDVPPAAPPIPDGLGASLRPYQREGFVWLWRMAELGIGACLADDMGLGKTVQTLAVLLSRGGPTLVVAPTSVCPGWASEARRFAPSLCVNRFGTGSRDLGDLGPSDLVVCSYGLLVSELDRLKAVRWRQVVLDEAHAIKNPKTQRHKAARALNADWRVTLTGTPIENRLGELHAQLDFLNPGALGSDASFRKRYARPIQEGDVEVTRQLRRIVTPLLLRRTKGEVLDDLPGRTEVDLLVEADAASASFYEALRQRALEELEASDDVGHIQVLAHLTRLRLAACSPQLVDGTVDLEGPKLEAFDDFVDALQRGGHRALVFSQFVKHLGLLRGRLEASGVEYQYLDGSTPSAQRQRAVDAFQGGAGRVFLISLKAGGTGLNLTAAETVLHMDPWWNPAVEDQASDRAHRIGQTRPVTVYRMIAKGTIEERILALHREKRGLADRLLSGAGQAAGLSAEELVRLLRDSG